jgi:shikimate kinase
MRIYLTGFMGAGKTMVGRALAQKLGCEFIDLDYEIEHSAGQSIESIFETGGESEFRKRESDILRRIDKDPAVIATGGGCFIYNGDWMLQKGKVVYLKVPFDTLVSRIGAETSRPLWRNAKQLYDEREQIYESAHLQVDGTGDVEAVAKEIMQFVTPASRRQSEF